MSFVRTNLDGQITKLEAYYINRLLKLIDNLPNKPATVGSCEYLHLLTFDLLYYRFSLPRDIR